MDKAVVVALPLKPTFSDELKQNYIKVLTLFFTSIADVVSRIDGYMIFGVLQVINTAPESLLLQFTTVYMLVYLLVYSCKLVVYKPLVQIVHTVNSL